MLKGLPVSVNEQRGITIVLTADVSSIAEDAGGDQTVTITATRETGPAESDITVALSLSGSATAGMDDDYTFAPAMLPSITILTGHETGTATLTITPNDDNHWEPDEAIEVNGTTPGTNVGPAVVTLTSEDDPGLRLSSTTTTIAEDAGATTVALTVALDEAPATDTTLPLSFSGTATKDTDYTVTPTTVTVAAGATSASVNLEITPTDNENRYDETANGPRTIVIGTTLAGYVVTSHTIDLTEDEPIPITLSLSTTTAAESADDTSVTVTATLDEGAQAANTTVQITVGATGSTATGGGTDYSGTSTTSITISAGSTSDTVQISIDPDGDDIYEGSETVVIGGTAPSGFGVIPATFTITDDDEAPDQVVLGFSTVSESAGATASTVTATLANSVGTNPQDIVLTQDVTVTLSLGTGGSATSGTDYTGLSDPLPAVTIQAGSLSGTASINITPVADEVDDDGETIPFTATATTTQSGVTLAGVGANLVIFEEVALISSIGNGTDVYNANTATSAFLAQRFKAGAAEAAPAAVTSVKLVMGGLGTGASVKIRNNKTTGCPSGISNCPGDTVVATLTLKDSLAGNGIKTFTAPPNTILAGGDFYWVMIHEGVTGTHKSVGQSVNPATTGETGWSLDQSLFRWQETSNWLSNSTAKFWVEVRGKVLPTPTVQFSASTYSATEGGTATVTVNLSEAPKREVVIPISAANQGNASSSDYSGVPESLTFGADDTEKSFTFTAVEDTLDDDGESVELSFGTLPSGVTASGTTEATVSITDNDDPPDTINLSFDPASVAEDATGNVAVKVVATLVGDSTRTVATTVNLATALGGTATQGTATTDDYTSSGLPSSVTIPVGQAKGEATGLMINPTDNSDSDGNRTITLGGTATGFTVNAATLNLIDDELPLITLTILDNSDNAVTGLTEADTAAKTIKIKATVDEAVSADTVVTLSVVGTATGSGTDYTATFPVSVTISDGGTSAETNTFNITTVDDNVSEGTETIVVSGVHGDGMTYNVKSATVNLADNDQPVITISLSVLSATEAAGNQAVTVRATRDPTSTKALSVTVERQSSSTAVHNTDYTGSQSVTISFTANQTNSSTATFNINPEDDSTHEGEETIVLGASVEGHTVTPATFTINDNDDAPDRVVLGFTTVSEGAGATSSTVTATLANSDGTKPQGIVLTQDVTVTLGRDAASDTATAGADYTNLQSSLPTVTISAGSLSGTASISITPVADEVDDDLETIVFTATASTSQAGVSLTGVGANLVITEDAALVSSIAESSVDLRPANFIAQAFGTGTTGAELTEVRIRFAGSDTGAAVRIRRNTAANRPDMSDDGLVATLVATSGDLSAAGVHGFTPASEVTINLDGAATYWVTIHEGVTSGRKQVEVTRGPDITMVTGWSLDSRLFRNAEGDSWGPAGGQVLMEVRGKVFPAVTAQFSAASYSATEGGNVSVTVTLSEAPKRPVTVPISAANQNSASDSDYSGVEDLTFGADETSKSFTFAATDDSLDDDGESVGLSFGTLPSGVTAGTQDTATVSITDNDDPPDTINLTLRPGQRRRGRHGQRGRQGGGHPGRRLDAHGGDGGDPGHDAGRHRRPSGHATLTDDYRASGLPDQSVTIPAGMSKGEATGLMINPTDNSDSDGNRTITLGGTSTGFDVNDATLTITDDELPVITLTVVDNEGDAVTSINEGSSVSVTITATFKDGATRAADVTVDLSLSGATDNTDYTLSATLGDITIEDGDTSASLAAITIAVPEEHTAEGAKTLVVGGTAAGFNFDTASITLNDDDSPSTKATLSVSPTSIDEEDGAQSVTITAALNGAVRTSATSVTVSFGNTGTAKIGAANDYEVLPAGSGTNTVTSGTITIAANQRSGSTSFRFRPVDDIIDEGASETITITGSTTASGLTGGVDSVDLTLDDDDSVGTAIQLTFTTASTAEGASPITNQRIQARFSSGKARTVATTIALGYSLFVGHAGQRLHGVAGLADVDHHSGGPELCAVVRRHLHAAGRQRLRGH